MTFIFQELRTKTIKTKNRIGHVYGYIYYNHLNYYLFKLLLELTYFFAFLERIDIFFLKLHL